MAEHLISMRLDYPHGTGPSFVRYVITSACCPVHAGYRAAALATRKHPGPNRLVLQINIMNR